MNETIEKFGYPATLVAEFDHWLVLLRPAQPTLGSLVIAAKSDATAFGSLPAPAYAELGQVVARVEDALARAVSYGRINYLMLMMIDPFVHLHAIPRYEGVRVREGREFPDHGWPRLPDLNQPVSLSEHEVAAITAWLKGFFA